MSVKSFAIFIFFLLSNNIKTEDLSNSIKTEKMKLYAIYTPSHVVLKDKWFLPSIQDDFDLIIEFHEQTCPSANYMHNGWTRTTIKKVELIIRAIEENWNKIFIFSDVDIQFFAPIQSQIEQLMEGKDMVIQKNSPRGVACSGFFACRGNEKTLKLWQDTYKLMLDDKRVSDQTALNRCLKPKSKTNKYNIIWNYLPNTFLGGGTLTGHSWSPRRRFPIPKNIVMHHANYSTGIKSKIAQLTHVRNVVEKRKMKN